MNDEVDVPFCCCDFNIVEYRGIDVHTPPGLNNEDNVPFCCYDSDSTLKRPTQDVNSNCSEYCHS